MGFGPYGPTNWYVKPLQLFSERIAKIVALVARRPAARRGSVARNWPTNVPNFSCFLHGQLFKPASYEKRRYRLVRVRMYHCRHIDTIVTFILLIRRGVFYNLGIMRELIWNLLMNVRKQNTMYKLLRKISSVDPKEFWDGHIAETEGLKDWRT